MGARPRLDRHAERPMTEETQKEIEAQTETNVDAGAPAEVPVANAAESNSTEPSTEPSAEAAENGATQAEANVSEANASEGGAESEGAEAANGSADASGDVDSADCGKKKKKRRRRKKKKAAEGGGDAKAAQAFSHLFGKASRQTVFKAGEVVAGIVRSNEHGALMVDLFGRALAYVDAREPHEIEALPEPVAPAPKAEAESADGASESASADNAPAGNAEATEVSASTEEAAKVVEATSSEETPSAEAGTEAAAEPVASEETAETSNEQANAEEGAEVSAEAASETSEGDAPAKEAAPAVEPVDLEPSWPEPPLPAVGTVFRGRIGSVAESGHMALVNRAVDRPGTKAAIRLARDEHRRVQGVVFGYNRGGFDVMVSGVRCFCPARSMSLSPIQKPDALLGQKLEFSVPPSRGGKSIVVSRRGILERELRKQAREHMKSLVVGTKLDGTVTQVRDYGLLVDIGGGVEGLVHQSEVSWSRGDRPADVAKPGDQVKVEILKVTPASRKDRYGKVSLSMRTCLPDPWDAHGDTLKQGVPLKGKVVRTTEFGAFVQLAPGVEGLLHISELGRDVKHASQVLSDGEELDVVIERMDKKQRRLSLSRLTADDLRAIEAGELDLSRAPSSLKPGKHIKVKILRTEHHGIFAQVEGVLGKRGRGYIPNREMPLNADRKKGFAQGAIVDVKIIGTDRDGGLKLSVKGLLQDEERSAVREYRKEAAQQGGFGTFADLLKAKLGDNK